ERVFVDRRSVLAEVAGGDRLGGAPGGGGGKKPAGAGEGARFGQRNPPGFSDARGGRRAPPGGGGGVGEWTAPAGHSRGALSPPLDLRCGRGAFSCSGLSRTTRRRPQLVRSRAAAHAPARCRSTAPELRLRDASVARHSMAIGGRVPGALATARLALPSQAGR